MMILRPGVSHQVFRQLPEPGVGRFFFWVFRDAKNPAQHADDIAIQQGGRLVEGDAANGPGGVAPDSRQFQHFSKGPGKNTAMPFDDELRGLLQVADAGVIAEPFPELVDFGGRRFRRGFNRGQFAQPAFPKRDHGAHLGLLQHDLGDPDGVGVVCPSPRQIAGIF